ncbi:DUF5808 domain-containing protein [Botrimarina sp.]|uniref:DUF5808 domain-containing protein n=1 Tax=Botrimarina sp. TaxID=2795802 RepID=UPI0032EE3016
MKDDLSRQDAVNRSEWANPANWRWGIYRSPRDSRVWVPKKPKWAGWTLNFAHRASYWWLAALLAPAIFALVVVALIEWT